MKLSPHCNLDAEIPFFLTLDVYMFINVDKYKFYQNLFLYILHYQGNTTCKLALTISLRTYLETTSGAIQ